jgi:uncharacterized protein with HEPN domain
MPRREELYLLDIIQAADTVQQFLAGIERERFLADELIRSAVHHQLMIIGEAVSRLPATFRDQHPEITWSEVVAFRNFVVHGYFALDEDVVWDTAQESAPEIRNAIASIIAQEYPDLQIPGSPQEG